MEHVNIETEELIDSILSRNRVQIPAADLEYKKYLEKLFDGYNKSYIIDTIYNITINPKFKYWFDCRAYDSDAYKLIWRPISTTFNGLYEMNKQNIYNRLPVHSYDCRYTQTRYTTPLEYMAVKMTYQESRYDDKFYTRFSEMFYKSCFRNNSSAEEVSKREYFEKTCIAALDLSMNLFKANQYEKIMI